MRKNISFKPEVWKLVELNAQASNMSYSGIIEKAIRERYLPDRIYVDDENYKELTRVKENLSDIFNSWLHEHLKSSQKPSSSSAPVSSLPSKRRTVH
jgi:predicted CopG family antitoxin